ncbi:MAG: TonB-dependent receptor domain-containing protein, partial [Bacteroidota bacterium]
IKDDILNDVRKNPLVRSPFGQNYIHRSHFFTYDDMTTQNYRPNVASNAIRLNGKLDLAPAKNLGVTFGGSFERTSGHDYIDIYSLMNYDQNPLSTATNWRVFGKMTQRFLSEGNEKASSNIKNVFYTIQADYSRNTGRSENDVHKDRYFDYGYIGKFTRKSRPFYLPFESGDSLYAIQVANIDTAYEYEPGTLNPYTSNYTTQYYDLTAPFGTAGYTNSFSSVVLGGGLVNGDNRNPLNVYGLWATTGRVRNGLSKFDNSQFRFVASFSADIKNHNIIVGGEFEQRTDRGWSLAASSLWQLARILGNQNITGYDTDNPIITPSYGDDTVYYVNYNSTYTPTLNLVGQAAPGFYENIREKLGYSLTDTVQTDILAPSFYELSMFTPDELITNGLVGYYGYDYLGNRQNARPAFSDYYNEQDDLKNFKRRIDAFRPTYIAGYIQDRFNFNDLTFNIGLRVDYFDANQYVLKDKYLLYDAYRAGDPQSKALGDIPGNIGDEYVVYVNSINNPTSIVGFRNDDKWYDASGNQITDLTPLLEGGGNSNGIQPYIKNQSDVQNSVVRDYIFKRYDPQVNIMPRIAFAFPISDEANFKAHYDVLTQRPQSVGLLRFNPVSYQNLAQGSGGVVSNPDLRPERTTEYELSFQQRLSRSSALSISAFYRELRNMIQVINVLYAYPITYQTYGNVDFGTTKGLSLAYDLRRTNNVRMSVSYTLSFANGTGSDPNTNFGLLAQQGQSNLRQPKPLNFDQRHTFVTSFDYHYGIGKDYNGPVWWGKQVFSNAGVNMVFRAGSGTPYTRKANITPTADFTSADNSRSVIEGQLNGSRLPWQFRIDARFDKGFTIGGKGSGGERRRPLTGQVYLQILNLLDTKNVVGVYAATGDPEDDGYITSPQAQAQIQSKVDPQAYVDLYEVAQNNPFNYSLPRRMRLGFMLNF